MFPWRFAFVARESIHFPPGKAGNVLRGGLGTVMRRVVCDPACPGARECSQRDSCAYAKLFEPRAAEEEGPSGIVDWPRPFVFRAAHLDGRTIAPRTRFHLDLHVFLRRDPCIMAFTRAFLELAREGFGATRGKAQLESVWQLGSNRNPAVNLSYAAGAPSPVLVSLHESPKPIQSLRICFMTATELKSGAGVASRPEFPIVFGRARDRVATLSALYGSVPLAHDLRSLGEHAAEVRMIGCELQHVDVERRSSRTGQRHPLGGFVGHAEYEGNLGRFLPILRAAEWTGIGRQTVWGKGEIRCFPSPA